MSTIDSFELETVLRGMIPDSTVGATALRAVAGEAITRWESRDKGRQPTFLPTSDSQIIRINDPVALERYRLANKVGRDWHEPDNQGITAYVIGDHLDNAMGSTVERGFGELNVVIAQEVEDGPAASFENSTFRPMAVVNLATLLSWATRGVSIMDGGIGRA